MDNLDKCIALLNEINQKFGLITNVQVQCTKENGILVFIQGLPILAFDDCDYFLKYFDTIVKCIEMHNQIASEQNELNQLIQSMRG